MKGGNRDGVKLGGGVVEEGSDCKGGYRYREKSWSCSLLYEEGEEA